jgi:hypothetical protein
MVVCGELKIMAQTRQNLVTQKDVSAAKDFATKVWVLHVLSYFICILSPISCAFSLTMVSRGYIKPRNSKVVQICAKVELVAFVLGISSAFFEPDYAVLIFGATLLSFGICRTILSQDIHQIQETALQVQVASEMDVSASNVIILHVLSYFIFVLSPISCAVSFKMACKGYIKPRNSTTVKLCAIAELFMFFFHVPGTILRYFLYFYSLDTYGFYSILLLLPGIGSFVVSLLSFGICRTILSQDIHQLQENGLQLQATSEMEISAAKKCATTVLVLHLLSYFIFILSPISCAFSLVMASKGYIKPVNSKLVKICAIAEILTLILGIILLTVFGPYVLTLFGGSLLLCGIYRTILSQDIAHLQKNAAQLQVVHSGSHPQEYSNSFSMAAVHPSEGAMPPSYTLNVPQTNAMTASPQLRTLQGRAGHIAPESSAQAKPPQSWPSMESLALELNISCLLSLAKSGCSTADLLSRNYDELRSEIGITQEEYQRLKDYKKRNLESNDKFPNERQSSRYAII